MPQSKERHAEWMAERRKGAQTNKVHKEGAQTDRRTLHLAEVLVDPIKRSKLILISNALDKETAGLNGKKVNLGSQVRYGINGFTFKEIGELLD